MGEKKDRRKSNSVSENERHSITKIAEQRGIRWFAFVIDGMRRARDVRLAEVECEMLSRLL